MYIYMRVFAKNPLRSPWDGGTRNLVHYLVHFIKQKPCTLDLVHNLDLVCKTSGDPFGTAEGLGLGP